MGRDAVGARLEPKGGLQTYFEPQKASLKDSSYLSGKPAKVTPTAWPIFTIPAADTGLARRQVGLANLGERHSRFDVVGV